MKYFLSTNETQGQRKTDFCWTNEKEPLHFAFECDGEAVDGACGCRRSFSGIDSAKATTTALIAELPEEQRIEIRARLAKHYVENWKMEETEAQKMAFDEVEELARLADNFMVGAIVEKRGRKIQTRKQIKH